MRYRFIGDSVLLVPFLKNLRRLEPAARIDLLAAPFSGQVLAGCPYVDRILPVAPSVGHRYDPGGAGTRVGKWLAYLALARRLRAERYDAVFVLKRSLSSALLGWASGAPVRAGFATEGRGRLLTHTTRYTPGERHEAESFLDVLRSVGYAGVRSEPLELWSSADEARRADEVLASHGLAPGRFAVVHAAASTPGKQWDDGRFAEICVHLWRRQGLRAVFTGGAADRGRYEAIAARLAAAAAEVPPPANLCGQTGLRVDLAVYRRARLFVGVDSGPMHVAVACGLPVVALFGPTDPGQWGPYEPAPGRAGEPASGRRGEVVRSPEACGACRHETCPDRRCMRAITAAAVQEAVDRRLASTPPAAVGPSCDGEPAGAGAASSGGEAARAAAGGGSLAPHVRHQAPRLSVALICRDEARIIGRTLASAAFADEVVVVDSGSTDGTVEIARRFTPHVHHQPWLGYAAQKNLAIDRTTGDWVLSLDADEIVEPELATEIRDIVADPAALPAYRIPRKLIFLGRWVRHGGWYPDLNLRLFRRGVGRFPARRVHEHVRVDGPVGRTRGALRHESHPSIEAYLDAMNRYSTLAVEEMAAAGGIPAGRVGAPALVARPLGTFLYRYLLLGGFLDGRPGLVLNLLHGGYVLAKYAKAYEHLLVRGAHRSEAAVRGLGETGGG